MRYLRNSRKPAAEVLEKSHSVLGPLLIISGKREGLFLGVFFFGLFFLLPFPWFFLGKQQFPYVLDGFGVIFLGFPTKKHVFCFSLVFPRENSSFLMFWTDLA